METDTQIWFKALDDLKGYALYKQEAGLRVLPGSPALLRALAAPAVAAPPPAAAAPAPAAAPQKGVLAAALQQAQAQQQQAGAAASETLRAGCNAARASKLEKLHAEIRGCTLCGLCSSRLHAVPGNGNIHAPDILFVDEMPSPQENETGAALAAGAHNDLLAKMIRAMGYDPADVFVTTLCKCMPPPPQRPPPESAEACRHFLEAQIALIQPRVIVLLGAGASMGLLHKAAGAAVAKTRGVWTHYQNIPVMPTYAPAYLNKFPAVKAQAWKDLQLVMKRLGKVPPAKGK